MIYRLLEVYEAWTHTRSTQKKWEPRHAEKPPPQLESGNFAFLNQTAQFYPDEFCGSFFFFFFRLP